MGKVIDEMTKKLHEPKIKHSVNDVVCETCELVLNAAAKYCDECGTMTELGRATEAMRTFGKPDKPVGGMWDTSGMIGISSDASFTISTSAQGIVWGPYTGGYKRNTGGTL